VTPTEAALGPGERQPVLVAVDNRGVQAALKGGAASTAPIQLAYQYLHPSAREGAAGTTPVGTGAVDLRLPQTECPSCHRPLEEDEATGRTPDICPYCFERLRQCPICGAPNSWLARTCVLDNEHIVRSASDWPMLGREPGHSGTLPDRRAVAANGAQAALGLSRRWSYPNVPPSRREAALAWSAPAAAYGMVAATATSAEGEAHVYAFDAVTGAPLWEPYPLAAPLYPDRGGISLEAGHLFAADVGGVVVCLDALRGTRLWETRLDGTARVYGAAVPSGTGLLLIATATADGAGCLFLLDAANGKVRSQTALPGPSDTAPAFSEGRAYAHTDDGTVVAIESTTGGILWQVSVEADIAAAGTASTATGFDAAPVVRDGKVFSASATGTLWCHDAVSGAPLWRLAVTNAPLAGTPAYDGALLYLPADDGVHLISAQAGRAVRRYPARLPVRSAPVVLEGGTVLFGATDGAVYGAQPGRSLERLYEPGVVGSQIVAAPACADGALFVAATNGVLYALTLGE